MSCNFELIEYESFDGNFDTYYNFITKLFKDSFLNKTYYLFGKSIRDNDRLWHIISEGKIEEKRTLDFSRAKYINLLISILTNPQCEKLCNEFYYYEKYHYKSGKKSIRAYIYCPNFKYLVILEKRNFVYGIITAYPIETNHKHNKILEDLDFYKKKREPI